MNVLCQWAVQIDN